MDLVQMMLYMLSQLSLPMPLVWYADNHCYFLLFNISFRINFIIYLFIYNLCLFTFPLLKEFLKQFLFNVLCQGDRVGSIEVGKDGDIVVWDR
jgi:hypothetical protein